MSEQEELEDVAKATFDCLADADFLKVEVLAWAIKALERDYKVTPKQFMDAVWEGFYEWIK